MAKAPRDVERMYTTGEVVAKLRRLADALESEQPFRIQVSGERLLGGPAEAGGDPCAQLGRCPPAEGQDEDLLWVQALVDACRDRLDDRRGLAGAGTGQHEQRAAPVVDDDLLRVVELGDHDRARRRPDQAVGGRSRRYWRHASHPTTTLGHDRWPADMSGRGRGRIGP